MNSQGEEDDSHQDAGQDCQLKIKIGESPAGDIYAEITEVRSDKGYISRQVFKVPYVDHHGIKQVNHQAKGGHPGGNLPLSGGQAGPPDDFKEKQDSHRHHKIGEDRPGKGKQRAPADAEMKEGDASSPEGKQGDHTDQPSDLHQTDPAVDAG